MKLIMLIYTCLLIAINCNAQSFSEEPDYSTYSLLALVDGWKSYDGIQFIGLSYYTSLKLVENDSLFFALMKANPTAYHEWLRNLQGGTFLTWQAQNSVEQILEETKLHKLKELMLMAVEKYIDQAEYKDMANEIKTKLHKVIIMEP